MNETAHDFGMMPSHPGAIVREEILAPLNLNVTQAAKALGVRRATLSDLLNEKAALSPEMALRIEKAFGVSMEMMLRIQTDWDIAATRRREGDVKVPRYQPEHPTP
jgi:addiction module HigA family antidote